MHMEFFGKVKIKLRVKNLLYSILFLFLVCGVALLIVYTGFSSEVEWRLGVRGSNSGIPVPNWALSVLFLILGIFLLVACIRYFCSFVKDTEYNKMLKEVEKIGNTNEIGLLLASIKKSPYPKSGDLRYCERLLYYAKGTDVKIVSPLSIGNIQTEIVGSNWGEDHYVCVCHGAEILKIRVSEKKVLDLRDDMRRVLMGLVQ